MSKHRKNIWIAFWFAMFSSLFLFISGTTGVSSWLRIQEIVLRYFNFTFLKLLFILMIIVASFGGLSVLIGGILIFKKKIFWGKVLINLGAGVGIIGFLLNLFISVITLNFSLYSFLSFSSLGIVFAVFAQHYANKK
jgi:hypothetical protein